MRVALAKVDAIRNSIIGFQRISWSEHIYPLVAALKEAGYEGIGYEKAREDCGTLVEQIKAAEARADVAEAQAAALRRALWDAAAALAHVPSPMVPSIMARATLAASAGDAGKGWCSPALAAELKTLVDEQAEDDGLWFETTSASEAYLMQELRRLHAAVEAAHGAK